MNVMKSPVLYFIATLLLPLLSRGQEMVPASSDAEILPTLQKCATPTPWSDNTYEELRIKLEMVLKEKNRSLISLDFKGLQAQVDVAVNHLNSQDDFNDNEFQNILKMNLTYLENLEKYIEKAKETARTVKEGHVVPLAALASIKSENDKCQGTESPYPIIFQTLSQLNKDFNEILMMSPQKLIAQKNRLKKMIDQLEDGKIKLSVKLATENFNFIQTQINTVTSAFEFDSRVLQIASH